MNKKKLYSELRKESVINYWRDHHAFPIKDEKLILWPALETATRSLPAGIQRQRIKFITGFIGNYHMMHKRGEIENNICVNCKKNKIEKSSHILLCTNEKATEFYHKKVKEELKKGVGKETHVTNSQRNNNRYSNEMATEEKN